MKREKTQLINIRNERRGITVDPADIKRIIREYYEQLYADKCEKLKDFP